MAATWMAEAACTGATELFFPRRGETAKYRSAVAICGECPVRVECLEYALAGREAHGVWGGLSERARRMMIRARARAAREAKEAGEAA